VAWVVAFDLRRERASTATVLDPPLEGARPLAVVRKGPDGLEGCLPMSDPTPHPLPSPRRSWRDASPEMVVTAALLAVIWLLIWFVA
jgi:hypothetical protein